MTHLVITRFNLRSDPASAGKALDERWLEERLQLFERFCYPSLFNQTCQNFKWLVLFDDATPEVIKNIISDYAMWPNFVPVYMKAGTEHSARRAVAGLIGDNIPDQLITTRIDNDDAISLDYIEHVQRYKGVTEPTVLVFPYGFIWHADRLYRDRQPHNPFTTFIEPLRGDNSSYSTIYSVDHQQIGSIGKLVNISDDPAWIQVVHGGNMANRQRGIRCSMHLLDGRFAVQHDALANEESSSELALAAFSSGLYMIPIRVAGFVKRLFKLLLD